MFIPIPYYPERRRPAARHRGVAALGTLKPGVTLANAERDLKALAKRQEDAYPTTNAGFGVELQRLKDQLVGSRSPIYIVFGAVGVVLLIACANVANLQLARGAARHRELSVRAALGAARGRIAQQLLTESILLSLAGGVAGLVLAWLGTKWLGTALANRIPLNEVITRRRTGAGVRVHRVRPVGRAVRRRARVEGVAHERAGHAGQSQRRRRTRARGDAQRAGRRAARAVARPAVVRRPAHEISHRAAARGHRHRSERT